VAEQRTANAATPPGYLGQLTLYEGDWDEARRLLQEALDIGMRTGERVVQEEVQAFLAELEILSGHPGEAVIRVEGIARREAPDYHVPVVLVWALLESGRPDEATALADRNVREARDAGENEFLLEALRVQGMALRIQNRGEEAAAALNEGMELARTVSNPYAEARIRHQLGLLEQQMGNSEAARHHLEESLTIFRRLGAKKDVERAEQDVKTAG
jgi:tetratricopeptide (TPR) repeat protein